MKQIIIMVVMCLLFYAGGRTVGHKAAERAAYIKGFDAGVEQLWVVRKDGYEFIETRIGCKCGNKLVFEWTFKGDFWPLELDCDKCGMVYTLTREVANE